MYKEGQKSHWEVDCKALKACFHLQVLLKNVWLCFASSSSKHCSPLPYEGRGQAWIGMGNSCSNAQTLLFFPTVLYSEHTQHLKARPVGNCWRTEKRGLSSIRDHEEGLEVRDERASWI